ncbi:MAG: hypothetical protein KDA17_07865, partial [Candidatus Saccharibacteria bacterium]|nr:hypothetical protein [Candidatus Saccharibacteria bacterium]
CDVEGIVVNWVKTVDELPHASGPYRSASVLVYCPDIKCFFTAVYNYEDERWEHFAQGATWVNYAVSHWAHLPEYPENL